MGGVIQKLQLFIYVKHSGWVVGVTLCERRVYRWV